jgi:cell division initiation protein
MTLTPLDIQKQRFKVRLKGYDPAAVEAFLEQAAAALEEAQRENFRLGETVGRLTGDLEGYRQREGAFKAALLQSQKVIDQMQQNARKQAELIVAEAETRAARLLGQSQNRLAQLQEEIAALKRQRIDIEVEIEAVIERHRRLLASGREANQAQDGQDGKLMVFKTPR